MMAAMQSHTALVDSSRLNTCTAACAVLVITSSSCLSRAALSSPTLLAASPAHPISHKPYAVQEIIFMCCIQFVFALQSGVWSRL